MASHSRTGFSDALPGTVLFDVGFLNPFSYCQYAEDFEVFRSGDFTVTKTGTGTFAATAGDGGLALSTTTSASGDINTIQPNSVANMTFDTALDMAFMCRIKTDSATNAGITVGLITAAAADPTAPTNGVYLLKASGATSIAMVMTASSSSTSTATTGVMADNTFTELGFFYDALQGKWNAYQDGAQIGESFVLTNAPSANIITTIAHKNGTAAARTVTIDYWLCAKRRLPRGSNTTS